MKKYVISLDAGTTSCRAIVFDRNSTIIATEQQEFKQIFPQSGWVEHDAMEIWHSQLLVLTNVLKNNNICHSDVAAVGITNQRETTVLWNKKTGAPVYNAIVWQDRRSSDYCKKLKAEGKEPLVSSKTGLLIDPYFSATKIRWILDNVPEVKEQVDKGEIIFGTVDTWILWNLTGGQVHATDYSNASRTLLYNIVDCKWDEELLNLFGVPSNILPEVRQSSEVYGYIHNSLIEGGIPVSGIAGDQQAATFGQGCLKPGSAKNTYGTGCFALLNIGRKPSFNSSRLLTTIAWGRKNHVTYAVEGSVFIAGAVVQWLRDGLKFIEKSREVESFISGTEDNGGIYLVPAFTGLGAPHWDPYARGVIVGISRGTTNRHIARAALESIAFQNYDILKAMADYHTDGVLTELKVDGGASKNNFLMQFQADILNCVVVRPKVVETTALGAAYFAGMAVNFWESAEEILSLWQLDRVFEPSITEDQRQNLIHNWRKAVKRSCNWLQD